MYRIEARGLCLEARDLRVLLAVVDLHVHIGGHLVGRRIKRDWRDVVAHVHTPKDRLSVVAVD